MATGFLQFLVLLALVAGAPLHAADLETYIKTKICNNSENYCLDNISAAGALPVNASQTGVWTTGRTWTLLNSTDSVNAVQSGAWTTGRTWTLSNGTDSIAAVQSGTWTVQQGATPAAVANAWPFKLTDGTNTTAVKAASTAALATDPAAVVTLSPNGNQSTAANQSTIISSIQILDDVPTAANGAFVKGNPTMGQLDDTSTVVATEDNLMPARITAQRAWHMNLRSASGVEFGTVSNPVFTSGSISSTVGSYTDKGTFTYGTDKFNPTGGIYQDTGATLTAGQVGVSRMTAARGLHVNLRDSAGTEFATINNPLIIAPANSLGELDFGDVNTSATTTVAVRRTTYTEQTTNAQRSIKSASANDTAAGTGARTVNIIYLDQTGAGPFTETLTLNGTTCVATVSSTIAYIEEIIITSAGSTLSNVGLLTFSANNACGGATIGTVAATDNQAFWSQHYVPLGKTANITSLTVSHNGTTVGSGGVFVIRAIPLNAANQVEVQISDFVRLYGQSSTFSRTYPSPIKVVGPARLLVYVTPETSSATTYRSSIDFYEQ